MIVGEKYLDLDALKKACVDSTTLINYTLSLIPTPVRHIRAIVDNQRYYVALHVRNFKHIPWYPRMELCNALLSGVRVQGVANELYDYKDLLAAINVETFQKLWEREEQKNVSG